MRIYLEDMFGFAEHQEEATYGLGYKLTLTENSDNAVLKKKQTQPPLVKLKLPVSNGMYHNIQLVLKNRVYY